MTRACPNCGSTNIEQYDASGASICTECAVVVEENAIVSNVDFVEGAGGSAQMVGQFVSATSSKAFTGVERGWGFSRDSRETTLANGKRRIQEVASRLRLGNRFIDSAHRLFTFAVEKNFVQGRRTMHVVAACLYIACRQEKSQHMLIDFSDALQVNVYTLGTCFLKFRRLLGLKLEILDPALYVYRFAAHLDLSDKANAVALTALRLVGRMKRDWIVAGRRPAGICAAALLIAARAHGFSRHPQDVTRILRVCGLTVSTRVREFEQTPSASLTLQQFNKVELGVEADPPIFTRNRIREARARAIQMNDEELLTSGALDDPMARRSASKWRDKGDSNKYKRSKQKEEEMENLYQSIETEMKDEMEKMERQQDLIEEATKEGQQQQQAQAEGDSGVATSADAGASASATKKSSSGSDKNADDSTDEDENNETGDKNPRRTEEEGVASAPAAIVTQTQESDDGDGSQEEEKDDNDEEGEGDSDDDLNKKPKAKPSSTTNDSAVATATGEGEGEGTNKNHPTSILKKGGSNITSTPKSSSTSTSTSTLDFSKKVTIMGEQLSTIPTKWVGAYPKSKHGKPIILPDQSTPEERLPSTIPVEGLLETKVFKANMPEEMVSDIESIFRTPTEIAQKEAIFNKINKDYIELQAQKEKVRKNADKEKTIEEMDMAEQEKSNERYLRSKRKRAGAGTGSGGGGAAGTGSSTTQEALLEAVSNRKISRKINYDAMSAIFDDEGNFSTETTTLPQAEDEIDADTFI